ncbi:MULTISPECIES: hypothetical protein [Streptomyces]|nr:hypothetical protein [Streptomyces sp. NRRL WC-3725]
MSHRSGHSDIDTTMGYNTVHPADASEADRAFILLAASKTDA